MSGDGVRAGGVRGDGRVTVTVDRSACCAMGRCVATEPALFDQDATTGTVILLDATPPPALRDSARLCAELCPCGAITVTETDGSRSTR